MGKCGKITISHILVRPGYCPFCLRDVAEPAMLRSLPLVIRRFKFGRTALASHASSPLVCYRYDTRPSIRRSKCRVSP